MSEELFRELQQDLQHDRLVALWKRIGNWVIGASVAVVLGTVAGVAYKHWRAGQAEDLTHALLAAEKLAKAGDPKGVDALIEVAHASRGEMTALAALRAADALARQGKREEAGKLLAGVAGGGAPFASLAALQAQLLGALPVEGEVEEGAPFAYTRMEMAAWAKLKEGKKDEAVALFRQVKDAVDAPMSQRERVFQALTRLDAEALYAARNEVEVVHE